MNEDSLKPFVIKKSDLVTAGETEQAERDWNEVEERLAESFCRRYPDLEKSTSSGLKYFSVKLSQSKN
jgi:hypothetical protein